MSFKRKQAHPQQANGKGKNAISESTVNSQRIGIVLKLEAINFRLYTVWLCSRVEPQKACGKGRLAYVQVS